MTYSQFIKETSRKLSELYPEREAIAIATRLLQHFCGISSYEHLVEPLGVIAPEVLPTLEKAVSELAEARPLQYIIGWQEFCGLKIAVEEGVLIPRPETEELIMWVAEYVQSRGLLLMDSLLENERERPLHAQIDNEKKKAIKILDAASGSGAIACALASKLPEAEIFACDISDKALEITSKNLNSLGFSNAQVFKCDLLNNAAQAVLQSVITTDLEPKEHIDIIVSNPPYVTELEKQQMRSNVLKYEPTEALFVPDTNPLLFYKALRDLALELLLPGGAIFMEINEQFSCETAALFSDEHFSKVEIRKDILDKPRMVMAVKPS